MALHYAFCPSCYAAITIDSPGEEVNAVMRYCRLSGHDRKIIIPLYAAA